MSHRTGAPLPPPTARRLSQAEIRVQSSRSRQCDEGTCDEEVRILVTTHWRRLGVSRTYRHFYCERHGNAAAGFRGVRVGPAPDEGGSR